MMAGLIAAEPIRCDCGNLIAGPVGRTITCRRCGRLAHLTTAAAAPSDPPTPFPSPLATQRRAICEACPHRSGEACGVLIAAGKPGHLWHPRGLPRPAARCPDGRWL